jgi:hypothetical protein
LFRAILQQYLTNTQQSISVLHTAASAKHLPNIFFSREAAAAFAYSYTAALAKVQHYPTDPQYVEISNNLKINPYLHQTRQGWENVDGRIYLLNSNRSMFSFRILYKFT